jgi:hypothetical protein
MQSACAILYCHLWSLRLCSVLLNYLINGTIFEGKKRNKKCVLISSATFFCNISHSRKKLFTWSVRFSFHIWVDLDYSGQTFEKCSFIRFHKTQSSVTWFVPCGSTDKRTDIQTQMLRSQCSSFSILRTRLKIQGRKPMKKKDKNIM